MRSRHFSKDLKNLTASHEHNDERVFWAEGMLSAKALRWECIWHVVGIAKKLVWLVHSKPQDELKMSLDLRLERILAFALSEIEPLEHFVQRSD